MSFSGLRAFDDPTADRLPPLVAASDGLKAAGEALAGGAVDRVVLRIMTADLISTVLLQRIYLGTSITLATQFLVLLWLLYRRRLQFSQLRLALYLLFWGVATLSVAVSENDFSLSSYLLGVVCYAPFLFVVPANRATYFRVLRVFQTVALVIAGIVFLQIAMQLVGIEMLNMDMFVPSSLVAPTMNYMQGVAWKAGMSKPNGFFMLEASYTSQFLATAFIIELAFFRRWLRLGALAFAILATFSGTGLIMILLTLPLLARRMWRQMAAVGVLILPLLGVVAYASGWLELASNRSDTFDKSGSSAHSRFVAPYEDTWDMLRNGDLHKIFLGLGPGKLANPVAEPDLQDAEYSAIPGVFLSYGLPTALLFILFTTYCLFGSGAPLVVMWAAAIEYHLMGGHFLIPPILNYCFILTSGWSISTQPKWRRAPAARANQIATL